MKPTQYIILFVSFILLGSGGAPVFAADSAEAPAEGGRRITYLCDDYEEIPATSIARGQGAEEEVLFCRPKNASKLSCAEGFRLRFPGYHTIYTLTTEHFRMGFRDTGCIVHACCEPADVEPKYSQEELEIAKSIELDRLMQELWDLFDRINEERNNKQPRPVPPAPPFDPLKPLFPLFPNFSGNEDDIGSMGVTGSWGVTGASGVVEPISQPAVTPYGNE